jgi:hypothetical protein
VLSTCTDVRVVNLRPAAGLTDYVSGEEPLRTLLGFTFRI